MSTQVLSDANPQGRVSARVLARTKPYSDLDLKFKLHPNFGDIVPLKDTAAVKNALKNLLLTAYGERPFQPNLGSNIAKYFFEPANPIIISLMRDDIKRTIKKQEPRVLVQDVQIQDRTDENALFVSVSVLVINTQEVVDVELYLERTR